MGEEEEGNACSGMPNVGRVGLGTVDKTSWKMHDHCDHKYIGTLKQCGLAYLNTNPGFDISF